jgi:hypothetical protein
LGREEKAASIQKQERVGHTSIGRKAALKEELRC